jgi:hypothetical protein
MQAKQLSIKVKKVVVDCEKCYQIEDVQCYNFEDLPDLYFTTYPYCFTNEGGFVVCTNDKEFEPFNVYVQGDVVCQRHYDKIVRIMQVCGEKLHNLNEMEKVRIAEFKAKTIELEKEWNGIVEVKI